MFYVYKITNNTNEKIYIGKTVDVNSRWAHHCSIAKRPKHEKHFLLHKAIAKYGEENFFLESIEELSSEQEAHDREIYWISFYKSNASRYGADFGYNLTDGGEGCTGYKHSGKNKRIMSSLKKGVYDGKNNPNWGNITSEETRITISNARKNKCLGKDNHQSKLTTDDVLNIRHLISQGISDRKLACQFGVTRAAITSIRTGKTWRNVF
jgi:group I intron endonuclease